MKNVDYICGTHGTLKPLITLPVGATLNYSKLMVCLCRILHSKGMKYSGTSVYIRGCIHKYIIGEELQEGKS